MFVDFFTQHSNLFNVYINFLVQNSGGGEHEVQNTFFRVCL